MNRLLVALCVSILCASIAGVAQAQSQRAYKILNCQSAPGTGDATCGPITLEAHARGLCVYVLDNEGGGTTFNLRLRPDPLNNWASGATKTAVNEAATCWYPTTLTTVPTVIGQTPDVVVTAMPPWLYVLIDKTAAVSTQFDAYVIQLR